VSAFAASSRGFVRAQPDAYAARLPSLCCTFAIGPEPAERSRSNGDRAARSLPPACAPAPLTLRAWMHIATTAACSVTAPTTTGQVDETTTRPAGGVAVDCGDRLRVALAGDDHQAVGGLNLANLAALAKTAIQAGVPPGFFYPPILPQ
jgi:hypothetical protein